MYFQNRNQAAESLVEKLSHLCGEHPLILGIPRGSVPMAKVLADQLGGDLDVVLVHKIGAPDNPEFAIGSVSEFGTLYRSYGIEFYELSNEDLRNLADAEVKKLKEKRKRYSPIHAPISPTNRTVVIVDDGIATGSTMLAAIRALRSQNPKKIIVAAPVASVSAIELVKKEADETVVLDTPVDFMSISQFYDEFSQVSDEEVFEILSETGKAKTPRVA